MVGSEQLDVLWSPKQVARYFGVHDGTIWKWIREKRVIDPKAIVHIGRRHLIPKSEIIRITQTKKDELNSLSFNS